MTRSLFFPFQVGDLSAPKTANRTQAIRQQLDQLLFTVPGERVNRPDFGCGVQKLVFGPASPQAARTAEYTIKVNIQKFLGTLITADAVQVTTDDATLFIDILYTVKATNEERAETFRRPLEGPP
jgi:phage baseplate assembly protein W